MAILPLSPGASPKPSSSSSAHITTDCSPVFATLDNQGYFTHSRGQTLLPSPGSENYRFLLYRMRLQQVVKSLSGDFAPQASQILPQLYISDLYTATSPQTLDDLGITHILSVKSRFTILPFPSPCVSPCSSPENEYRSPSPSATSSTSSSSLHTSPSSSNQNPKSRFRAISIMLEDASDAHSYVPFTTSRNHSSSISSRSHSHSHPSNDLLSILPITTRFIQEALARKDAVNSRVLVHCDVGKSVSASVVLGYLISVHFHSYEKALEFLKSRRRIAEPHVGFVRQLKRWEEIVRLELEERLEKGLKIRFEEQRWEEERRRRIEKLGERDRDREGDDESSEGSRGRGSRYRTPSGSPRVPRTPASSPPASTTDS